MQSLQHSIKDLNLFIKTMLSYCSKCRKTTESKNQRVAKTKNRKTNVFFKMCSVW